MFAFPHRRTIQRTVLVTLAAWVLAVMAGIANACLPHAGEPGHDGQLQAVEHGVDQAPCHEAWDAGALTVLAKQPGSDIPPWEAAAVQTLVRSPEPVSDAVTDQAVDGEPHANGPPGAIRFLRLRL
jgi:hypothetical protein